MRSQKNTIELYLHSALGVKIKFNSLKRSIFYLIDAEILEILENMSETMYNAPGIGLAANQVGVLKRLIVMDCSSDEEKVDVTNKTIKYFLNKYDCDTIDGVRIKYPHGWALVRLSNTQPVIVCRFESNTEENLQKIKDEVFNKIGEFGNFDFNGL